eukprot:SAG31_NODE_993_length_10512_cov_20.777202_4_plen_86_part_00
MVDFFYHVGEFGFLLGPWIDGAKSWANSSDGGTADYYEWQARSQVSTWWPIAPSARKLPVTFTKLPVLDNVRTIMVDVPLQLEAL